MGKVTTINSCLQCSSCGNGIRWRDLNKRFCGLVDDAPKEIPNSLIKNLEFPEWCPLKDYKWDGTISKLPGGGNKVKVESYPTAAMKRAFKKHEKAKLTK